MQRHYPAESSRQMSELIADLRGALEERLQKLDGWTSRRARKRSPS